MRLNTPPRCTLYPYKYGNRVLIELTFQAKRRYTLENSSSAECQRGYLRLSGSNETEAEQADTDMPSPEVGGVPPKARPRTENYDEGKYVRTAHIGECLTTSYAEYSDEVIP